MANYELDENLLIEGFNPAKLEDMRRKAERNVGWETVYGAFQNNKILQAEVTAIETIGKVACAIVMVEDVKGMIPAEYFGVNNKRQMRSFMGKKVAFTIVNYDRKAEIFTGSRIEAQRRIAEFTLRRIEVGQSTPFIVTGIRSFGLFGDIGGIQAFVPIHEVRFGWIDNLYEEYSVGDHLWVKVLEIKEVDEKVSEDTKEENDAKEKAKKEDEEKKEEKPEVAGEYRVSVSAKALHENPWDADGVAQRFVIGSEYVGEVSGIAEYGVFVRLADGVDSLARHLKFENLERGDKVSVRVNDIDVENEQVRSRIVRVI